MNWEIGYAHKSGNPIIGVFLYGESDAELPEAFNEYGDKCVGSNSDKIDQALKTNNMFWEDEDGNQLLTNNSIYRHTC